MNELTLKIITPDRTVFNGALDSVNFGTSSGLIQILKKHCDYITDVYPSVVVIKEKGAVKKLAVSEGIFKLKNGEGVMLVKSSEYSDEIDVKRAEDALKRAKERLQEHKNDIDENRARLSLKRAEIRIKAVLSRDE